MRSSTAQICQPASRAAWRTRRTRWPRPAARKLPCRYVPSMPMLKRHAPLSRQGFSWCARVLTVTAGSHRIRSVPGKPRRTTARAICRRCDAQSEGSACPRIAASATAPDTSRDIADSAAPLGVPPYDVQWASLLAAAFVPSAHVVDAERAVSDAVTRCVVADLERGVLPEHALLRLRAVTDPVLHTKISPACARALGSFCLRRS